MSKNILMDVDTGIDDALAILFAVNHPDLNVMAISCVAGNGSLPSVVANTLKILDAAAAPDIPVAAGATRPLIEHARDASHVHGEDGLGNTNLPESSRRAVSVHAVELLRQTLADSEEPLTIVALAPLTNLALLLRMYPECAEQIERIVFMGGAAAGGNATATAEFNIWHDPEAAHIVLNSGVALTMYGLDVFNTIGVDPNDVAELSTATGSLVFTAGKLLGYRTSEPDDTTGRASSLIGDAGAVCALVAPHLMTTRHFPIAVELSPGLSRGQTIVDQRTQQGEDAVHNSPVSWPTADVVLSADVPAVLELFLATVRSTRNV